MRSEPTLLVGAIATEARDEAVVTVSAETFRRAQLSERFGSIVLGSDVLATGPHLQRLIVHNCAAHLVPGGSLSADPRPGFHDHALACGFEPLDDAGRHWRRTLRRTIHDVIAEARASYRRITTEELVVALERRPDKLLIVDVRNSEDRRKYGVIEGSIPIPRTVLEWRLDPTSGYTSEDIAALDRELVIVCNEGYSSSLAAAALQDFGFVAVTDLVGGMVAWIDSGHAVVQAVAIDDGFTPAEDLDDAGP